MKYVHAPSAMECVFWCVREDESCRSINFRKASNHDKNCELLKDVDSDRPELLLQDEKFDYLLLLDPSRVGIKISHANDLLLRIRWWHIHVI